MRNIIKSLIFFIFVGIAWCIPGITRVGNPRGITINQTGKNSPPVVPPPSASSVSTAQRNSSNSNSGNNAEGDPAANADGDNSDSPNFTTPQNPNGVQLGRFQTSSGYVRIVEQLLNSYKNSVVRVSAVDESGKVISEAMGVAVGVSDSGLQLGDSYYIATTLSVILGNDLQWADRIDITHDTGTKYSSEIALIDEQLDLVLLKPKNKPTPIRFITESQERAQVDVITISFERDRKNDILPTAHRATVAAINPDEGTIAISGKTIQSSQHGTAIINMQGQLMGMLLPNGNGVLSSAIRKDIEKAIGKKTFSPRLVGMIMGRGVLVDPEISGAYPTIEEAIEAIRQKQAPKADPERYLAAKNNLYKPKEAKNTILKVSKGVFTVQSTISVPEKVAISGTGPTTTTIIGNASDKPVFLIQGVKQVSLSNFRVATKQKQNKNTVTIEVANSENISILGSVIEAKEARASVYVRNTKNFFLAGNTFPEGKLKAVYCQISSMNVNANAFLGKWPQSIAIGKNCNARIEHNLFIDNDIAIAISGESKSVVFSKNTFIRGIIGARFYGKIPSLTVEDNLFYNSKYSLLTLDKINPQLIGRNSAWQSVAFRQSEAMVGLDFVKGKPIFRNPEKYDYRLLPGSPGASSGLPDEDGNPTDIGAFQRDDFLLSYTPDLLLSLQAAIGQKNLAEAWGYKLEVPKGE